MTKSNRPYRVGMARESQRYIEPDAIYDDLRRGPPTQIPARFGFTWTPVNGLGAAAAPAGFVDDVFDAIVKEGSQAGSGIVQDGKSSIEDRSSKAIEDFLNSTPGKQLLDRVKSKAADGVTEVVKEQGPNLIMLAVAGGAVGGVLSEKLGKAGTIGALLVAGWAALKIMNAKPPQ